jgi:hypothetical protein
VLLGILIDGGDDKAAAILLSCTLRYEEVEHRLSGSGVKHREITLTLTAPVLAMIF